MTKIQKTIIFSILMILGTGIVLATGFQDKSGYSQVTDGADPNNWTTNTSNTTPAAYSTAFGFQNTASGDGSTAWGHSSTASGGTSTAWGEGSTASGWDSTAWGSTSTAWGNHSTAWGVGSTASGVHSTAWGWVSTASGDGSTAWGEYSTASGNQSTASGTYSTASGYHSTASGYHSTASGIHSTASGTYSTASGVNSTASGGYSTASGYNSTASGDTSTANTIAEFVIGRYNIKSDPGHESTWDSNDAIFRIGNGSDEDHRHDAFMVKKNGDTYIYGNGKIYGKNYSAGNYPISDIRLKKNIKTIQNPLEKISKLRGVYFDWKKDNPYNIHGHEIGLIAQEVEKVVPELVSTDKDSDSKGRHLKSVAYEKTVALLIEGMKEQQKEIKKLKKEIEKLKKK